MSRILIVISAFCCGNFFQPPSFSPSADADIENSTHFSRSPTHVDEHWGLNEEILIEGNESVNPDLLRLFTSRANPPLRLVLGFAIVSLAFLLSTMHRTENPHYIVMWLPCFSHLSTGFGCLHEPFKLEINEIGRVDTDFLQFYCNNNHFILLLTFRSCRRRGAKTTQAAYPSFTACLYSISMILWRWSWPLVGRYVNATD